MQDRTVHQRAPAIFHTRRQILFHPQRTVKISRHHHHVFAELNHGVDRRRTCKYRHGGTQQHDRDVNFPPQQPGGHRRKYHQADFKFVIRGQRQWRDHAYQQRAQRAADSDHQIKRREVNRMWLHAHQFAVAEHACDEQPCRKHTDLPIEHEVQVLVGEHP